jgi:hypothetical protein
MTVSEFYYPEILCKYDSKVQDYIDVGISLPLCLAITGLTVYLIFNEYIKERVSNKKLLKQAITDKEIIEKSLEEIRTLRGIIPICSHCRKIKDTCGSWKAIEDYLYEHSDAQLSHGICPECLQQLYPDMASKILSKCTVI